MIGLEQDDPTLIQVMADFLYKCSYIAVEGSFKLASDHEHTDVGHYFGYRQCSLWGLTIAMHTLVDMYDIPAITEWFIVSATGHRFYVNALW